MIFFKKTKRGMEELTAEEAEKAVAEKMRGEEPKDEDKGQKFVPIIKTITWGSGDPRDFDKKVNKAIKEGWRLVNRYVVPMGQSSDCALLVAELRRFVPVDEVGE